MIRENTKCLWRISLMSFQEFFSIQNSASELELLVGYKACGLQFGSLGN